MLDNNSQGFRYLSWQIGWQIKSFLRRLIYARPAAMAIYDAGDTESTSKPAG
jgi:hypothetical protein